MWSKAAPTLVLVVSPLISLMEDQIAQLPKKLKGATLNSSLTKTQKEKVRQKLISGKIQVLFVAPETLTTPSFLHFIQTPGIPAIRFTCIDEIHCVSEWSHNFRPSYLQVCRIFREKLGVPVVLGLTATATRVTESSIVKQMGLHPDGVFRAAPIPANLKLAASRVANRREEIVYLLKYHRVYSAGSVIVYCMRQGDTESVRAITTRRIAFLLRIRSVCVRFG